MLQSPSPAIRQALDTRMEATAFTLSRLFLALGGSGIIFFSWLFNLINPEHATQLWGQLLMAAACLLIFGLSFIRSVSRSLIIRITDPVMFIYGAFVIWIAYDSGWAPEHMITGVIAAQLIFIPLRTSRKLLLYFLLIQGMLALTLSLTDQLDQAHRVYYFLGFLCLGVVNYAAGITRLRDLATAITQEEQTEEGRSLMAAVIESTPDMIWCIDTRYRLISCNDAYRSNFRQKYGHEIEAGVRLPVFFREHGLTPAWGSYYPRVFQGESIHVTEWLRIGSSERMLDITFRPVLLHGRIIGAAGFAKDVTERYAREQELTRIKQAIESSRDAICILTPGGEVLFCNQAFTGWFGPPAPGASIAALLQAQGCPDPEAAAAAICHGSTWAGEFFAQAVSGARMALSLRINPIGGADGSRLGSLAIFADISGQKQMEEAIRTSEERYAVAVAGANDGLWDWDIQSDLVYLSPRFWEIMGYDTPPGTGIYSIEMWKAAAHPEDLPLLMQAFASHLKGQVSELKQEFRIRRQDGQYVWVLGRGKAIRRPDGWAYRVAGSLTDISDRKQVEQAMQAQSALLETVINSTPDWIFIKDAEGRFQLVNQSFADARGMRREELIGKNDLDLGFPPELVLGDPAKGIRGYREDDLEVMRTGERKIIPIEQTTVRNSLRMVSTVKVPLHDPEGRTWGVLGFSHDITEIKTTESLLQGILESSLSGIMAFAAVRDESGEIIDFQWTVSNPAAERMVGFTSSQLLGARLLELMPGNRDAGLFEVYKRVALTREPFESEFFYDREHIAGAWFHIVAVPLGDGFAVTFSDITGRKLAAMEAQMLSLVASNTINGVIIADGEGRIEWVNKSFERITGYTLEEVQGRKPGHILQGPSTDPATRERMRSGLRNGEPIIEEILNYRKDGSAYWLQLNINPILDSNGKISKFIGIETDITERKMYEKALEDAKHAAEHAARAKAEFLANMSHEIRTPMNAVIGMTGLLQDTPLTREQREYVETIRNSGDNLLTVLNDILDFSKIDSGRMELEQAPFSLVECVEDVLDLFAAKAGEKHIELAADIAADVPAWVLGDPTRLRQILVNLVGNSLKFTDSGEVVVEVNLADAEPGRWRLRMTVRDTGIGIASEHLPRLFQSFSQVDASTTRKYGGTGLGLAICKKLVELMNGRIWVESAPGSGTAFHFEIEAGAADEQQDPKALAQLDLSGKHVLLVDDNRTNLFILQQHCLSWGMIPFSVQDPADALEYTRQSPHLDLAVLDMQMPGMSGAMLIREIRKFRSPQELPAVLLSSMGEAVAEEVRPLFGVVLNKPARKAVLRQALAQALGGIPDGLPYPGGSIRRSASFSLPPGLRILVAEDNTVNQRVALRILEKLNYQAEVVSNGLEAVQAVAMRPYDLIFMDMQMPEMDGIEATLQIRSMAGIQQPVIIAMTANAMVGDRERCLEAGMNDYVSKPVKLENIAQAIERTCISGPLRT
jgi:PAS domain S-box-containing protein